MRRLPGVFGDRDVTQSLFFEKSVDCRAILNVTGNVVQDVTAVWSGDDATNLDGLVLADVTETDVAQTSFLASVCGLEVGPVTLENGTSALGFRMPEAGLNAHQELLLQPSETQAHAMAEILLYMGHVPAKEIVPNLPRIRARAASRQRAGQSVHGAGTLDGRFELTARDRAYSGFFAFDEIRAKYETFAGHMSEEVTREIFVGTDAAIVLPYDPKRDRVLMVEQVRMGLWGRGDKTLWLMEPIAGLVDPDETPEDCARREAVEEAGLVLDRLEPVAEAYASPGSVTDFFYIYVGLCDLPDDVTGVGGLASEGEDIRSHLVAFDDLLAQAENLQIANAPMTTAIYWLAHHRARLRSGG